MSLEGAVKKEKKSMDGKNMKGGFFIWTSVDVFGGFRRAIKGIAEIIDTYQVHVLRFNNNKRTSK